MSEYDEGFEAGVRRGESGQDVLWSQIRSLRAELAAEKERVTRAAFRAGWDASGSGVTYLAALAAALHASNAKGEGHE